MKTIEVFAQVARKIMPWIVIPTIVFASVVLGLLWGEIKKGLRS